MSFIHPGLLQTETDFSRIKEAIKSNNKTIVSGWDVLTKNTHASVNQKARAVSTLYRGQTSWMTDQGIYENYSRLFNDAASAYALAIRWKVTGDESYAATATAILDDWSSTLTSISGSSDKYLAAGLYGYQLANAGELLRDFSMWKGLPALQDMLVNVFYKMNHDFLLNHNGSGPVGLIYWANWDLAQLASMLAIGVFSDRQDIYQEAIEYIKNGEGNGAFNHAIWKVYPDQNLAQIQESGRDQGHATLVITLIGTICQMAYNQGEDLFSYNDNLVLKGAEYVAKYNLGYDVPFTTYTNGEVTQDVISSIGRGTIRPMWELLYNHYVVLNGIEAPYIQQFAEKCRPEGGGGNYGDDSGGYDQLGYGTLLYTLR